MLDAVLLARLQFALTVGFHFIFPPITIGLAWVLVILEYLGWKRNDSDYKRIGAFFGKLLGLTFAVGVATGVVMEFQFGTNWAVYSKFVGDIFGAPLAAEGVLAFFLESIFLGLYLFGRERVSPRTHWISILMVAIGSTLSAFWIIVANSWQQTPAGFVVRNGRAELVDFWAAVFNPSTLPRYFHTVDAALITGAFFVAGISAYFLVKGRHIEMARKSLRVSIIFGLIVSLLEAFPLGHLHSQQVANTQPEKFAVMMGVYQTQSGAPMALFAIPSDNPPELKMAIEVPGLLSFMTFGSFDATIKGLNEFPRTDTAPLFLPFVSYHNMVALGTLFILLMALSVFFLYKKQLWEKKWLLKALTWSIPLPVIACQLGWIAAEVGRQPWIVYKLLRTSDAISPTSVVSAESILFSIILFGIIYLLLGSLYLYLLFKKVRTGPEEHLVEEAR